MRLLGFTAAATLCATIAACGSATVACTDELRSVLQVDVIDSVTGKPAAAGSTVLLRGTKQDSITVPSSPDTVRTAHVWFEDVVKAGTYSVTVLKSGYLGWTRNGIQVTADACHVTTHEVLTAKLQTRTAQ